MLNVELPDGLSIADFKGHPVTQLMNEVAHHGRTGLPTAAELDALRLSDADRREVEKEATRIALRYEEEGRSGDRRPVWADGEETALKLVAALPVEQQSRNYVAAADVEAEEATATPEELAAKVPRL